MKSKGNTVLKYKQSEEYGIYYSRETKYEMKETRNCFADILKTNEAKKRKKNQIQTISPHQIIDDRPWYKFDITLVWLGIKWF